jgi:hypothetical protein
MEGFCIHGDENRFHKRRKYLDRLSNSNLKKILFIIDLVMQIN